MIDHRAAEILLATAIDFPLAPDEQATLDAHLAGCDRCRAIGAQLRREALLLREMPAEHASPAVRMAVEAAVLQSRPQTPRFLLLLAAALLMALAVGSAIILSGDFFDRDGLVVNPSPSAAPSASEIPGIALPTATLAYVEGSGTNSFIHTIEPDGSNDRTLTEGWSPAWSPDGSSIAYSCPNSEQASDVCVMGSDGAAQSVLVGNDNSLFSDAGQWSPSGGQILVIRGGGDSHVGWIANRDGTGVRELGEGMGSWSPDGSWIMLVRFPAAPPGPPVVSVIRPDGSQLRDLGEGYSATWSPDSSQIAFMVNGDLRAYDVADGSVSVLHDQIPGGTLTWVADDLIAIGSEAGLYMVDLATGDLVELAAGLPIRSTPVVSPDGQWLAFAAADGDSTDIYLVPVAGGRLVRVTTNGVSQSPAWQPVTPGSVPSPPAPPDTLIAYEDTSTHLDTGMFEIHTIRADGTDDRTLAAGNTPTWSPDGRRIAYECDLTPSGDPPGSICMMDADGTNNRTLVQGSSPQWSPDGLSIAYSCGVGTADALPDICTMDADGSRPAVLISEAFVPFSSPGGGQFWSPDGSHILFSRSPFDFGDSWVANADGTGIIRVGDGRGTWSPDGSWIMLESGNVGPQPDVSVVRPDGSDLRLLGNAHAPSWSPDSQRIAFIAVSGALQAFDVESGAVETLDESAAWSNWSWFTDNLIVASDGNDPGIYLIDLESGEALLLSTVGANGPIFPSPDGQWLAFMGVVDEQPEIYVAPLTGAGPIRLTTTDGASQFSAWQPATP